MQARSKAIDAKLIETCARCGRALAKQERKGSLTGWIFGSGTCSCSSNKIARENRTRSLLSVPKPQAFPSKPGDLIDERYEIIEPIGKGGMSVVYKVRDVYLDSVLAVKVLNRDLINDPVIVRRLQREAESQACLTNENTVAVYSHGITCGDTPYIVLDYVEGEDLGKLLRREGKFDGPQALNVFEQLCDGLASAHDRGLIHRDVKPNNVILKPTESGGVCAKLVDFGIARIAHQQDSQKLTSTGEIFGSPMYMSPEQCIDALVDERSDIYSLGCLMYHCLSGHAVFEGVNPVQIVIKQLEETPVSFTDSDSTEALRHLERIVMKCLAKNADDRYQTMRDLKIDIMKVAAGKSPVGVLPRFNLRGFKTWLKVACLVYGAVAIAAWIASVFHYEVNVHLYVMIGLILGAVYWTTYQFGNLLRALRVNLQNGTYSGATFDSLFYFFIWGCVLLPLWSCIVMEFHRLTGVVEAIDFLDIVRGATLAVIFLILALLTKLMKVVDDYLVRARAN